MTTTPRAKGMDVPEQQSDAETVTTAAAGTWTSDIATTWPRAAVDSGARTEEAAALVDGARQRIDALDGQIIALVRERMTVSGQIQRARLDSGGRRVSLARENDILAHFRNELGKPGTTLAMTLLDLCRGRV